MANWSCTELKSNLARPAFAVGVQLLAEMGLPTHPLKILVELRPVPQPVRLWVRDSRAPVPQDIWSEAMGLKQNARLFTARRGGHASRPRFCYLEVVEKVKDVDAVEFAQRHRLRRCLVQARSACRRCEDDEVVCAPVMA